MSTASADEPYVFRREGQFWHLAFAGESRLLKEQIGFKVIAYLLQRPDEEVDLLTLNRLLDGPPPLPFAANALEEQSGVHDQTPGATPLGPDLDVRTRREYRAHLQALSERINQASLAGDADTSRRLQREVDTITALLRADTSRGGRRRSTGDPLKRLRERTSHAVRRALEAIKSELPDLARHLHQTMKYPRFRAYRPSERLPWRL